MGTWGYAALENDSAAEILEAVDGGSFRFESVMATVRAHGYLEAEYGQIVIALASLAVAALDGRTASAGIHDASDLAALFTPQRISWIRDQVERAISGPEHSELFELWEDSPDFERWLASARELVTVLDDPDRKVVEQ